MEEKKTIILDLTDCKYLWELHERIRVAFDFPEWYGANLSAFDDLMETECDADEVKIIGSFTMTDELQKYMDKIVAILDRVVKERKYYSSLYAHIKPFSYRIDS